ncbi:MULTISPECIES: aldo/keto reductase [Actinosynnema]|uniref:aldo/keto reductase n=1 Tax=Actinosynnema TaxID=40566 RepID=UPI0020A515E3|nr:aldo/keto reductase [Actinosynnema pretiosum]MCP2096824.1 D-threo-aldose 1-dehydrogenase [Actinosynnema pretiosum]
MIPPCRLGFGAAPLGNLYEPVADADAEAAVRAAWEAGIRYYDTAPHYGLGLSERRLGAALAGVPRAELVLSTKVGRLLEPTTPVGDDLANGFAVPADARRVWDFSADGVRRSLESSADRLGVDRVDVVYLHDPDHHWRQAIDEAYPALADLRDQGVVRAVGVGMNQWRVPERFVRETDLDVVLLAGRHTLLERSATGLLDLCAERGVAVVAAAPFNSGLLAERDVPDGATHDYAPAPPELLERARALARTCAAHGVDLPSAALQFPLRHPAVRSVLVGMRSAAQVRANAAALAATVPGALWEELA